MTTRRDVADELDGALAVAAVHRRRIEEALSHLHHCLPLAAPSVEQLGYEDTASLELLLSRFAKLQDLFGAKVFPLVAELTAEPRMAGATFIDLLNRLEKIGAIPSAHTWRRLREVRNTLAHDYPGDPEMSAATINEVVTSLGDLLAADDAVRAHVARVRVIAG